MTNVRQNGQRKGIRREGSRRKTDIKTIKIEEKEGKEQELTERPETALHPPKESGLSVEMA